MGLKQAWHALGWFRQAQQQKPQRETLPFPMLNLLRSGVRGKNSDPTARPNPRNLRNFSKTPLARRAINSIKNPIAMLDWEIAPKQGIELNPELERQIAAAKACFERPNNDDSFRTLLEKTIEDMMMGSGAIEVRVAEGNVRPVWLYPVDGTSIQVFVDWDGRNGSPRYAQVVGYGEKNIELSNDELLYITPNPTNANPFGLGPLEVAFRDIARQLGVADFAANVASNQRPQILIDMGDASPDDLEAFRSYWVNEVEGRGSVPIVGFSGNASDAKSRPIGINRLYPEGDNALYLKYQEWLAKIIAISFDLSPQNLGVENNSNRATAQFASERDWDSAIKPSAMLLASHFTRDVLETSLGFSQLRFMWRNLDLEDEVNKATAMQMLYETNSITGNGIRAKFNEAPLDNEFADLTFAETQLRLGALKKGNDNGRSARPKDNPANGIEVGNESN